LHNGVRLQQNGELHRLAILLGICYTSIVLEAAKK
jgi:hypothetical protein